MLMKLLRPSFQTAELIFYFEGCRAVCNWSDAPFRQLNQTSEVGTAQSKNNKKELKLYKDKESRSRGGGRGGGGRRKKRKEEEERMKLLMFLGAHRSFETRASGTALCVHVCRVSGSQSTLVYCKLPFVAYRRRRLIRQQCL